MHTTTIGINTDLETRAMKSTYSKTKEAIASNLMTAVEITTDTPDTPILNGNSTPLGNNTHMSTMNVSHTETDEMDGLRPPQLQPLHMPATGLQKLLRPATGHNKITL